MVVSKRRGDRQVARETIGRGGGGADGRPAGRPCSDLHGRVLYRDNQIIVIDKPAGLPVHAGPKSKMAVESMLDSLRFGLTLPPIPAHRLDHDTSGCLILARNDRARRKLGRLFSAGRIDKTYWAVVSGAPATAEGRIDLPLRKVTDKAGWRIIADPAGQPAATDYRIMGRSDGHTWLELRPHTGRTHQVRVHCAALGCPILGDPIYGTVTSQPMQLMARAVTIPFYEDKPPIQVVAPPPPHMSRALRECGHAL